MPIAIYVLGAGVFVINTGETVIMGLLENVSSDLHTSISNAGYLVSAYAAGVVLGAPVLTPLLIKVPRRRALAMLMGMFALGNAVCTFASNYELLLVTRIATALAQAAFLGLSAVMAMALVPAEKQARAIAAVFFGSTIAIMFGAPAGAALGQALGWRSTFLVLTVLASITVVALYAYLPLSEATKTANLRREFSTLRRPDMLIALATTSLGFGGTFTTYTFIQPMLTDVAGVAPIWVPVVLLLLGFGMFLGNPIGGKLADRSVPTAVKVTLLCLAATLGLMSVVMGNPLLFIFASFLFGMALFAAIPALQMQVMSRAGDAPVLSAAFNIAAFNLGNAFGAWVGSIALKQGVPYRALPLIGLAICLMGVLLSFTLKRPRQVVPAE